MSIFSRRKKNEPIVALDNFVVKPIEECLPLGQELAAACGRDDVDSATIGVVSDAPAAVVPWDYRDDDENAGLRPGRHSRIVEQTEEEQRQGAEKARICDAADDARVSRASHARQQEIVVTGEPQPETAPSPEVTAPISAVALAGLDAEEVVPQPRRYAHASMIDGLAALEEAGEDESDDAESVAGAHRAEEAPAEDDEPSDQGAEFEFEEVAPGLAGQQAAQDEEPDAVVDEPAEQEAETEPDQEAEAESDPIDDGAGEPDAADEPETAQDEQPAYVAVAKDLGCGSAIAKRLSGQRVLAPGERPRVEMIVITGGPCAGKTSGIARVKEDMTAEGWTVLLIPETATELIDQGIAPWTCSTPAEFQRVLFGLQIEKENAYLRAARGMDARNILIVADRGLADGAAYMSAQDYRSMLDSHYMDDRTVNNRYLAVFHMVTAANGALEHYTVENNGARIENADEAIQQDDRTLIAWSEHPHLHIIDNDGDFAQKLDQLMEALRSELK